MTIVADWDVKPQTNPTNNHLDEEERAGFSTLIVFLLPCGFECLGLQCVIVALSGCAHLLILFLFAYREKYSICICIQSSEFELNQQKLLLGDQIISKAK